MASDVEVHFPTLLVAAIDFGTSNSGWAYAFKHEVEISKCFMKTWSAGSGDLLTEKTPTVLLIRPDKTLEAFGYEAENRYRELSQENQHTEYFYFRGFKMDLYRRFSKKIRRDVMLTDEMGKQLRALDVFAMAIKFLVDDLLRTLVKSIDGIEMSDIQWVLTIPAIWTDAAKQFMKEAAEMAGISQERLSIALEPEAASVYCRNLSLNKMVEGKEVSMNALPVSTKYMVLDAGGGTIDITVHEVTDDNSVKEIIAARGGGWGGTLVNLAFEELLEDLVGKSVYKTFIQEETEDWLDILREFEVKKKTIRPDKDGRIILHLPLSIKSIFTNQNEGRDLATYLNDTPKYSGKIKMSKDKIYFSSEIFKQLFEESYSRTIEHVEDILRQETLEDLKLILMVGGYSESPMLQQAIIRSFPNVKVVVPVDASSAVLKGAVIFGRQSGFIKQRVLKYTYGVRVSKAFIEGVHPESRKVVTDHGNKCYVFSKHVEKGQIVNVGEPQAEMRYTPHDPSNPPGGIPLYASILQDPKFIKDGCFTIGRLKVDVNPEDLMDGVLVSFSFGGTDIKVNAVVEKTGERRSTIDLLS